MDEDQEVTLDDLLAEFPVPTGDPGLIDQQLRLLKWLHKVFALWNNGVNQEVTARRHEIASTAGKAYLLLPDHALAPFPPSAKPRDAAFAQWLLSLAINTLIDHNENVRTINIWLFTPQSKRCLGE